MPQFSIFTSGGSAPILYGTTGSLIDVLDYCLITGSGWLKPIPNSGSFPSVPNSMSCGCWKQPTGAGFTLFVNDSAPNATALYREAWATGWETLNELSASVTNGVGSGSGQFPLPAQLLTNGHVVIRKSTTSDKSNSRQWIVAADSSSFYLFVSTGDASTPYYGFAFGDIYSYKSASADAYRCIIIGRNAENSSAAANEGMDLLSALNTGVPGSYIARSYTGNGTSITASKHGDGVKGSTSTFLGNIPYPNPVDTALWISPIWIAGEYLGTLRGQLRGLYQPLHATTNFVDGQEFSGSADYSGKTFRVIKPSVNSGFYIIETSNTLLTN